MAFAAPLRMHCREGYDAGTIVEPFAAREGVEFKRAEWLSYLNHVSDWGV